MPDEAAMHGYDALTHKRGLVDFCDRTQIEFTGEDRVSFLHNLCTNDIKRMVAGDGCEAYITSVRGKVLAHVFVFCTPSSLVLETAAGQGDALMSHFDRYIITEDVQLHDRSADWCEYLLSGPQANQVLTELGINDLPSTSGAHQVIRIGDVDGWIRQVPILSATTYLIGGSSTDSEALRQSLFNAGCSDCNLESFHMARLEAGYPWFPVDVGENNLPQEVARDQQAISFQKGCYLGQETVARLDALGHVNQIMTVIKIEGSNIPVAGMEITSDGQTVGHVTSAAYSPRFKGPIASTILRCSALKSSLQVGESIAAVVPLPLD